MSQSNIMPACPKCHKVSPVKSVLAGFYCGGCGVTFKTKGKRYTVTVPQLEPKRFEFVRPWNWKPFVKGAK